MFRGASPEGGRLPYEEFVKPGVDFVRDEIVAIDPVGRHVATTSGSFDADVLVVAPGADYDFGATPGLSEADEVYSFAGAAGMRNTGASANAARSRSCRRSRDPFRRPRRFCGAPRRVRRAGHRPRSEHESPGPRPPQGTRRLSRTVTSWPTTSSSAFRSTARPKSSSAAASPSTGMSRSIRRRSRPDFPASMPSVMSRRRGRPRPACSPKAPRGALAAAGGQGRVRREPAPSLVRPQRRLRPARLTSIRAPSRRESRARLPSDSRISTRSMSLYGS